MSTDADVTVIGAGVVGLATAREIRSRLGGQVLVIDKEDGPAQHQSGRNSGVVHSGLYYAPGSAKARLVAEGRRRLLELDGSGRHHVDWCGKVVVATRVGELEALAELQRRGRANGVEVRRISPSELAEIEPHVSGVAALHVPGAGITDYRSLTLLLAEDLQASGGSLQLGTRVVGIEDPGPRSGRLRVVTERGSFDTRWLVNCAGLHSDRIARFAGCDTSVRIVPFRGEYLELVAARRHLVRHLVYPVPDPRWPFLGVHASRTFDGTVHVGPNAVLALGREAYDRQIDLIDARELVGTRGLRPLARRYWRTGAGELIRSRSRRLLLAELRRLLPEVEARDLVAAGSGIRAQAIAADGTLLDDFAFATSQRAVHVLNAPSPAATASLAIGAAIAERLQAEQQR